MLDEDIVNDLSWCEGKIVFCGELLIDVIEEVSWYMDKMVVLGDVVFVNM